MITYQTTPTASNKHRARHMERFFVVGLIICIDFILLFFAFDSLSAPVNNSRTIFKYVNFQVLWFVPLSATLDSEDILHSHQTIHRFICHGLTFGIITPLLDLLNS